MYKKGVSSLFLNKKMSGKKNINGAGILNVSVRNIPNANVYKYKIISMVTIIFMVLLV